MDLSLRRSSGYIGSWLVGRAGFLDSKQAEHEGWVIPKDRKAAEKVKQELQKKREDNDKEESERKKKKARPQQKKDSA